MAERLSPTDVSFLYLEDASSPMHVGSVAVFEQPTSDGQAGDAEPFGYEALLRLVDQRIGLVPRYRQRVRAVPGHLANPVWVDDADFDVTYHVRRSALPRPGTHEQLLELASRVLARRLDEHRPLWEMYLVEGLAGGRCFALISKTHQAMVDGVSGVDIGTVLLDTSPQPAQGTPDSWQPPQEPGALSLVAGAVADIVRRPTAVVGSVQQGLLDVGSVTGRGFALARGIAAAATSAARPAPASPLHATIGEQRRLATARTSLEDYRRVRQAHGGSVNDVVLATVAGALRAWLLTRGEPVTPRTTVRTLVPVSTRGGGAGVPGDPGEHGADEVSAFLLDLPVGEPNPVMRLHQVAYAMKAHKETNRAVGAEALVRLSGFAPPTMHALGARVAGGVARRLATLVVTNVPGPQVPLFLGAARMQASFPATPLVKGQAVSIGLTSYAGEVCYGVLGDRDAMPDVAVLAECLEQAIGELVDAS